MQNELKIATSSLNQIPFDWENNLKNISQAIEQAKNEKVDLLCFPELSLTGYCCERLFLLPYLQKECLQRLEDLLPQTKDITIALGLPILWDNKLLNTCCVIQDGNIQGFVPKQNLSTTPLGDEREFFSSWPESLKTQEAEFFSKRYPLGTQLLFKIKGSSFSIKIGDDINKLNEAEQRPTLILNPSADYFAFNRYKQKQLQLQDLATKYNTNIVYTNLLGNESGTIIFDGAQLMFSNERLLACAPRFSFQNFSITTYTIGSLNNQKVALDPWENCNFLKEEEFARSVSLGLFDYQRKSHSKSLTLSISGGADSASCAALVGIMVHLGVKELGIKTFLEKLNLIFGNDTHPSSEKEIVNKLLICFYQATRNSSSATAQAAQAVAEEVGAIFYSFNIDNIIQSYTQLIEETTKRTLSWDKDDQALQNIQARVRLPSAWLITNITNSLLLVTSNRSEALVGYTTMDGDTAGCLAPLGGIDKAYIRKWLIWLEQQGLDGNYKLPALKHINSLEPTAELRPSCFNQTDEKDLMPYTILSEIEKLATMEMLSPSEILIKLKEAHPDIAETEITKYIDKFFQLWTRNQWKRDRYAIAFHVDNACLNQDSARHFPNLSGSFYKKYKK